MRRKRLLSALRRTAGDERGVAAIEFAMIAGTIAVAMLNALDIAKYYYQRMELESATQMGAQSAWSTCDVAKLPASTNCPNLVSAVTTAIQSSSLGTAVTLKSGSPAEGYYCLNSSNALVYVSTVAVKPANCSSVGVATGMPADYIKIETSFSYTPMFGGASVASLLPATITATSLMRLQ
jgi:Flp pilus assembly protein TadG